MQTPVADASGQRYSGPTRGIAAASVGLGYFSMIVFFWHPFSMILASVGLCLGVGCMTAGLKGGVRGENIALIGTLICATSLGVLLTLNFGLRYLQWLPCRCCFEKEASAVY